MIELHQSNERNEEYRQLLNLMHLNNCKTSVDATTTIDYSDDEYESIEKNFCLDDHTDGKFIFLYGKPALSTYDDDDDHRTDLNLNTFSNLQQEME